jgi:hypothetical protein
VNGFVGLKVDKYVSGASTRGELSNENGGVLTCVIFQKDYVFTSQSKAPFAPLNIQYNTVLLEYLIVFWCAKNTVV